MSVLNSSFLKLDYVLDLDRFERIQDDFAKATGLAMITVDYKGIPITKHSGCSQFCRLARDHEALKDYCERCDSRGGLEAARLQKPYIYLCHLGIVDFAIPIIVEGQYLGAVMAGQVLLEKEEELNQLERIWLGDEKVAFQLIDSKWYNALPKMQLQKIQDISNMIFHINNYIVSEAVKRVSLVEMTEKFAKTPVLEVESVAEIVLTETSPVEISTNDPINFECKILQPAFDYMEKDQARIYYIDKMASLCNVSTSYFSKLFRKTTGLTFSGYINQLKIEKAKEMLRNTNTPILNISLDLGYEDSGYFIKVFKKQVGVTPLVYRKNSLL